MKGGGEGIKPQKSICEKTAKIIAAARFMKRPSSVSSGTSVGSSSRSGYKAMGFNNPSAPYYWSSSYATFDRHRNYHLNRRPDHDEAVQIQHSRDEPPLAREELKKQRSSHMVVKPSHGYYTHDYGYGYTHDYGHGDGYGYSHGEERSVDKLASEYIRKVHDRNAYDDAAEMYHSLDLGGSSSSPSNFLCSNLLMLNDLSVMWLFRFEPCCCPPLPVFEGKKKSTDAFR